MHNRGRSCLVGRGRTRSYMISRGEAQSFVSNGAKLSSGDEIQCQATFLGGNRRARRRRCSNVVGKWSQMVRETRGMKGCILRRVHELLRVLSGVKESPLSNNVKRL